MDKTYDIDSVCKPSTIVALVFDGLSIIGFAYFIYLYNYTEVFSLPEIEEALLKYRIFKIFENVKLMETIIIIESLVFVFNLYVFVNNVKKKFSKDTSKKVFIYQIVFGIIDFFFNQIPGILHLVSGVDGYRKVTKKSDSIYDNF